MTAPFGATQLGGVADVRLDAADVDNIGSHHDNLVHEIGPPDSHGHSTIYLDNTITFENYHWWAKRAREAEKHLPANAGITGFLQILSGGIKKDSAAATSTGVTPDDGTKRESVDEKSRHGSDEQANVPAPADDLPASGNTSNAQVDRFGVTAAEWETAQRAARTASWGAVFYLITTDILGPYVVPWAIAQLGYGPGIALFIVFAVLAYYSGMQLWKMFIGLDSPRYPMRNYGDLAFRLFGNWARIIANFLQSFQFFLNVTICIVANVVVAELIFTLIGFLLGQIRTLQRFGYLANLAVWLNITIIISTIAGVYIYEPNYPANAKLGINGPIVTSAGLPIGKTLADNVNGMMNGVFAYGGATMFNELMAEMRRPFDFWKALLIAEIFISGVYIVFGLVVYAKQGQYCFNPVFQGISDRGYNLQTLGNAVYFTVSVIAALLYGNIGLKVFYAAVLRDVLKFPPLETKKGKYTWAIIVPIYWSLAFVLAAAVPQISNLSAFEGALTIMMFSYVFPPLLTVAYNCQRDAALPGEYYNPRTGETIRQDGGVKRWWRGFKKQLLMNTWDSIYFLAAAATAILGIWASIDAMVATFQGSPITSFGCANPAG